MKHSREQCVFQCEGCGETYDRRPVNGCLECGCPEFTIEEVDDGFDDR